MIRTETSTIIFTDLVGSTELAVRLGHTAYEALRRSHFDSLRLAASVHRGREVKSTGDGLVFTFGSASEAVTCMIRMQQTADMATRRNSGAPKIRIGASCGETNQDGNDIFGIAVIEAARLCAAALPGQIVTSDLVRGVTRGLGYKFDLIGELTLKGIPEPILAYAVEWIPREDSDDLIALPPRITPVPSFGLYGRAREQAIIARCWEAAQSGQPQIVLLAGEPGIGKTRLAVESGRIAHREGAIVLMGTCDEDVGHPYRPFVEALRHYVTNAPDEVLLQHVHEHHGDLLRIVPSLAARVPNLPKPRRADAGTERYLMFEAVTGLLATASKQRPIVLILDDLQWAGAPEFLLLKHIVRSGLPMRLLIIGTYRDSEKSGTHPLAAMLADLRGEPGIERIAIRGLDEEGVVKFVMAAVGHDLDESQLALARALSRDTAGSPLFVGEILRNLMESGAAFRVGGQCNIRGDIQSLGIPEGVKEAIERRLRRLSVETNRILSIASVIGLEFDVRLLDHVAEMPEVTILDALDEAKSAGLVSETSSSKERYAFTHMLMRGTLYDALNPTRRARMHERIGIALEQLYSGTLGQHVDELARHWIAAAPVGDARKAIGFARQAGDRALTGLAFEQAAKYYEQALSVLADQDRDDELLRCDLLIALGDAQRRAGDAGYRGTVAQAVQIARSGGDRRRFALAALGNARPEHPYANSNLVDQSLIDLYEEAISGLENEDENILRARLFSHLAGEMLLTPQRDRRKELSRQAVEIARRCGDRALLAQALHIYASAINDPTTLSERLELSAEQAALADELESLETRWAAAYQRLGGLLESADFAGAKQMLARMSELASKLRQPFFSWGAQLAVAMLSLLSGAADAEQEILAAFHVGTAGGQPEAKQAYISQLSVLRRDQGRHAELIESVRGYAETLSHLPVWRVILAGLYCETDQFEEARRQIDKLEAYDFKIPMDWTWASVVVSLAQICTDLKDQKLAAIYYPQLQSVAGQVGVTAMGLICYGSLAFPCAQLAACLHRWREAEQYFDQATTVNAQIGARTYLVRTRRAYANMLLDRELPGDRKRAAALIEEARGEAHQLGMRREIERLDRLLHRTTAPVTAL
jgi:class 3 adenylate cyclase/tetratricopeptide (TPR) repeat protein